MDWLDFILQLSEIPKVPEFTSFLAISTQIMDMLNNGDPPHRKPCVISSMQYYLCDRWC